MKYYQDITLIPDAEVSIGFLWQKVYQQIHLALVENKTAENQSAVAVSFPGYGDKEFPLGNKLRLFSESQDELEKLDIAKWLNRLADYTHCTSVKEVPLTVGQFVGFKRKQFKSNLLKEAKRRAKHKGESIEKALSHFQNYETKTSLPFINFESLSSHKESVDKKRFKLFIEQEIVEKSVMGDFNCYGLGKGQTGKTATVPWF